jgi:hypothetical protein
MRIENDYFAVVVEPTHGRIQQITEKQGGFELITEPRLADNFRLLVPIPDMHGNYILGAEQSLSRHDVTEDAMELHWAGPLTSEHGSFDIAVTLEIKLVGEELHFGCHLQNNAPHQVAEVWYPMICGMTGLGTGQQAKRTQVMVPVSVSHQTKDLFNAFGGGNTPGYGMLGEEYSYWYPGGMPMPFSSIYNTELDRALYVADYDLIDRCKVLRYALMPGVISGRTGGDWPTTEELGGEPVGLELNWTHFPYTPPGESFDGSTVVLRGHSGNWRDAALIYREWFTQNIGLVDSRNDWLRNQTAYATIMCMLPEDQINLRYADIPQWAELVAEDGYKSVLFCGWQFGGHDRGYPHYEIEPRLGTWDELEAGVRACHDLGLRVSFFANIQTVDISLDWYKDELHKYEINDIFGCPFFICGWGMGTLGARKNMTRSPLSDMNPSHPEVRELLVTRFKKLAEIGADGIHLDKNFVHALDFNPRLTVGPDQAMQQGIIKCMHEILDTCRAINPDFCVSYENNWDRLLNISDVAWWAGGPSPIKVAFPQWASTTHITQPFGQNVVNTQCLGGNNIMFAPGSYTKGLDYPPLQPLRQYTREVTRIRDGLIDNVSRAELIDAKHPFFAAREPTIQYTGPFADSPDADFTVFAHLKNHKRAVVLANLSTSPLEVKDLSPTNNPTGACRIYQPFQDDRDATFPVTLTLPAEHVAFVVEQ